jgi:hypothetical protein
MPRRFCVHLTIGGKRVYSNKSKTSGSPSGAARSAMADYAKKSMKKMFSGTATVTEDGRMTRKYTIKRWVLNEPVTHKLGRSNVTFEYGTSVKAQVSGSRSRSRSSSKSRGKSSSKKRSSKKRSSKKSSSKKRSKKRSNSRSRSRSLARGRRSWADETMKKSGDTMSEQQDKKNPGNKNKKVTHAEKKAMHKKEKDAKKNAKMDAAAQKKKKHGVVGEMQKNQMTNTIQKHYNFNDHPDSDSDW